MKLIATEEDAIRVLKGKFALDIPNWNKYNRDDHKGNSFRLNTDWYLDPKFHKLPPSARLLWILLLTLRGRFHEPLRDLSLTYLRPLLNLNGTSPEPLVLKLWKSQLIILYEQYEQYEHNERTRAEEVLLRSSSPPNEKSLLCSTEKWLLDSGLFSENGIAVYVKKLGKERFDDEVVRAHESWLAKYGAKPEHERLAFVTYFNRWVNNLGREKQQKRVGPLSKEEIIRGLQEFEAREKARRM